jgi:RNA polymerase sigma-70 factor, ECF subfamily
MELENNHPPKITDKLSFDLQVEKWIEEHGGGLMLYINGMIHNQTDAEDIWQETFIKVFKSKDLYRDEGFAKAWIYKIAKNTLIDFQRKKSKTPTIFEINERDRIDYEDATNVLQNKELNQRFEKAISNLPVEQREIYLLRQRSGMPFKDIAQLLDEPLNRILARMHLAMKKLNNVLEEYSK